MSANELTPEEMNAQTAAQLPDKEAMSLLDVNADLHQALDLAAPIDAAPIGCSSISVNKVSSGRPYRKRTTPRSISIYDPVSHLSYVLNPATRTAQKSAVRVVHQRAREGVLEPEDRQEEHDAGGDHRAFDVDAARADQHGDTTVEVAE